MFEMLDLFIGFVVGCAIGYFAGRCYRVIGANVCAANAWSSATIEIEGISG